MSTIRRTIIGATSIVLITQLASARPPDARLDQLRHARDQVASRADTTKGGPRHRLLQERTRIDGLIDDLERGRSVDPTEIDRALERANQPLP